MRNANSGRALKRARQAARTRRRRAGAVLVAAIALVLLSACGGGGGGGEDDTLLGQIKASGELKWAMAAYPPQTFQDADGSWAGFDVDIIEGFAEAVGAELVIEEQPFDATIAAVSSRRAAVTIGVNYSAKREEVIDFTRAYVYYLDVIGVRADDPLVDEPTLEGLDGKKIGVVSGSFQAETAKKIEGAEVVTFSDTSDLALAVAQGRVDAMINVNTTVSSLEADPDSNIAYLGPVPEEVAADEISLRGHFGVPRDEFAASYVEAFNEYIKEIQCDGTLAEILAKYDLTQPEYTEGLCDLPDRDWEE